MVTHPDTLVIYARKAVPDSITGSLKMRIYQVLFLLRVLAHTLPTMAPQIRKNMYRYA